VKNWEHPAFLSAADATYFNHTIVENTSPAQMTTLDVRTGKELWQYAASRQPWPYIFTNVGRLFLLDDKGVKEYAVAQPAESISDKQTQTELARAYLAKKDLKDAAVFAKKASDIDASYPPLVRVRAELLKAQGRGEQAAKELAQYAGLVGLDSKDGLRAVEELKQGYGLMWATPIGAPLAGEPVVVGDRVVSVGRGVERELAIVALNADSGETAWRFGAERFVASVVDGGGLWYAAGRLADGNAVELYRVDLRTGEQRPVASWRAAQHVDQAWIAAGSGKVFVAVTEGDLGKGLVTVGSAGFDMRSGARMSEKSYSAKVSAGKLELSFNLEKQEWVIEKKNSAAMPLIKSLWPPSGFRIQSNRLYAFTSEGLAYSTFYKEVEQTAPSARKSGNP
jgi:outer membrane protein assembly factor BamB